MTRNGKIARLPKAIRDQLNKNLEDNMPGCRLVEWLNSLPEVQQVLEAQFEGRAINEVNLSEWRNGGFLDWQQRQDMLMHTQELMEEAKDLKSESAGVLAEHLSVVVAGRYAELLNKWNGEVDEGFMKKLKALRLLSQDVAVQRRGDLAVGDQALRTKRLALEEKQFDNAMRCDETKALERCVDASKEYPEVADTFRQGFALLDEYEEGKRQNSEYERRQRVKATAEQRLREVQEDRRVNTARAESAEKRRQWMVAHPGEEIERSEGWRDWKIDKSKRLKNPALMPAKAIYAGGTIDWSKVDGWLSPQADGPGQMTSAECGVRSEEKGQ